MMRLKGRLARLEKMLNPSDDPDRHLQIVFTSVFHGVISEFTLDRGPSNRRNGPRPAWSENRLRGPER
jgi:hypothetical protein